jgi:hypothetical protein
MNIKLATIPFVVAATLTSASLAQAPGTGPATTAPATTRNPPALSDMNSIFQVLDTDRDGKITRVEFEKLATLLHSMGVGPTTPTGRATERGVSENPSIPSR